MSVFRLLQQLGKFGFMITDIMMITDILGAS